MTVRTRFAPSPTGRLHLGNVRAAAFNWLFARKHGGAFVLRIEDTDVERNVEGAEEALLDDLRWLGLHWDEGPDVGGLHGPYRQSERGQVYRDAIRSLLDAGKAYRCFCPETAEEGKGGGPDAESFRRYDGRCRHLAAEEADARAAAGEPHVVRLAVERSGSSVDVHDEVFGDISFPLNDIDDFILQRSDGRPTYNFAVVVDDVSMRITHVIRGVGHLSNTPKQLLLFGALGAEPPVFAHLPTVLGPDGRKLSKREGAAAVEELRRAGIPADAVLNYVSLLGWSHPEEREILSREELIEALSLDRVGRADTQFDPEKLRWVSQQHIARETLDELTRHVEPFVDRTRYPHLPEDLRPVVDALRTRLTAYGDINEHLALLFPPEGDPGAVEARRAAARDEDAVKVLREVRGALERAPTWDAEALGALVREVGARLGVRGRALFGPVRQALIGAEKGPDIGKILAALGRREALSRLDDVLAAGR